MRLDTTALPPVGDLPIFADLPTSTEYRDEAGNVCVKLNGSQAFDLATNTVVSITDANEHCLLVSILAEVTLA